MNPAALELNDSGILATSASGSHSLPNPGVALIEGRNVVVGRQAAGRARVKPRRIHDRFWQQLDTQPLRRPFPSHLSAADLVYQHLTQIWSEIESDAESVILAVPGSYSDQQLGLVLGIARTCGIPVNGMVDAAVAAVSYLVPETEVIHLDMSLHAAVLTVVHRNHRLTRQSVEVDSRVGLADLYDRWAKSIAADFLRTTRFDPLHLAETEQALFDQLPGWLLELRKTATTTITLEAGGRRHTIEISRSGLAAAVQQQYDRLTEVTRSVRRPDTPARFVLSQRVASLPGLETAISAAPDTMIEILPIGAATLGAIRHASTIVFPDESLPFITDLPTIPEPHDRPVPRIDIPTYDTDAIDQVTGSSPTHIVVDGVAHQITGQPLVLGVSIPADSRGVNLTDVTEAISSSHCSISRTAHGVIVEDHSTSGTFVNGKPVSGRAQLTVGDKLRLGTPGIEIDLISVAD